MNSPYGGKLVDRILPDKVFEERFCNSFGSYIILGNDDLIHFSKYDNERSIPNITDGLKISFRGARADPK